MEGKEAIELLTKQNNEVEKLRKCNLESPEFIKWHRDTRVAIENIFGKDSSNCKDFTNIEYHLRVRSLRTSEAEYNRRYVQGLNEAEAILKSMIDEIVKYRIETKPRANNHFSVEQLYDAIDLHPLVIQASRSCYMTGHYRPAILDTFISLVDYIKQKTNLDLDGDNLINKVFSFVFDSAKGEITRYPIIAINELLNQSDRDEQLGFMYLCKGGVVGIRNPKAHKLIPQSNPLHALEYLSFASMLFRRIDEGKIIAS